MGYSSYFFVGPYFVLDSVEQEREQVTRACSAHANHPSPARTAKFCSTCGAPVVDVNSTVKEKAPLSTSKLPAEFEDWVWTPESLYSRGVKTGQHIWLPNHLGYSLDVDDDTPVAELSAAVIQDYLARFNAHYERLISYVESNYPGALTVKFGAISYSH